VSTSVGQPLKRKEDPGFLTARERYVADLPLPGALHAAFVRSPHAHAAIRRIDAALARQAPGVAGVYAGADVNPALGEIPTIIGHDAFDEVHGPGRMPLAAGRARYVGEPVAVVVADTAYHAQDAADLVAVDYDPLPAVTDAEAALAPNAPRVHADLVSNLGVRWRREGRRGADPARGAGRRRGAAPQPAAPGRGDGGSTPAIANAVLDALAPLGVQDLDIPFTADTVWRAIHGARGRV
jgi:carbon-monoxide dehydrogenase large subunit